MTNISCHKKFQRCVNRLSKAIKQSKNKKVGFSTKCPYSVVIPTVNQGMDIGILFSQLGNDMKTELWVLLLIYPGLGGITLVLELKLTTENLLLIDDYLIYCNCKLLIDYMYEAMVLRESVLYTMQVLIGNCSLFLCYTISRFQVMNHDQPKKVQKH